MKLVSVSAACDAYLKDYLKYIPRFLSVENISRDIVSFSQFLRLLNSPGMQVKANEAMFPFQTNSTPNVLSWQGFSFNPGLKLLPI